MKMKIESNVKRLLALGLCSLFFSAPLWADAPTASIQKIFGTVELKKAGADWTPAKAGDALETSTLISTGFKSTAFILVGNTSLLVRPITRLSLKELLSRNETETVNVALQTGRIRLNVQPPAGGRVDFTITMPTATASVRGTEFDIDPQSIQVREGTVRYQALTQAVSRPVLVGAGQTTWVNSDTGGAVNPLAAAELNRGLPALSGGAALPPSSGGASLAPPFGGPARENSGGTLSVQVTLESK
jgi:hypothetical protein